MGNNYVLLLDWMFPLFKTKRGENGSTNLPKLVTYAYIYSFSKNGEGHWYGNQETLANYVGTTRQAINGYLKELSEEGFIIRLGEKNYQASMKKLKELGVMNDDSTTVKNDDSTVMNGDTTVKNDDTYNNINNTSNNNEHSLSEEAKSDPSFLGEITTNKNSISPKSGEVRHPHGHYGRVWLTDKEWKQFKMSYPTIYLEVVNRLDTYCESHDKHYANYLPMLESFAKDVKNKKQKPSNKKPSPTKIVSYDDLEFKEI